MSFKRKYNPDQKALGVFVSGMPAKVQVQQVTKDDMMTPFPADGRGYRRPWRGRDALDQMIPVLTSFTGEKIVICPECRSDVEPFPVPPDPKPEGEVVIINCLKRKLPNFCRCPKCSVSYFIYELIKDRSLRMKLKSDEKKDCFMFADAGAIINVSVDGFHEEHRFVKLE